MSDIYELEETNDLEEMNDLEKTDSEFDELSEQEIDDISTECLDDIDSEDEFMPTLTELADKSSECTDIETLQNMRDFIIDNRDYYDEASETTDDAEQKVLKLR